MARKRIGQLSWVDGAVGWAQKRRRDRLTEIAALLDWRPFEALLSEIHSSRRGEPSYPPLAMFKMLLLPRWSDLSDPAMEEALFNRLSFRRFAEIGPAPCWARMRQYVYISVYVVQFKKQSK